MLVALATDELKDMLDKRGGTGTILWNDEWIDDRHEGDE